MPKISSILDQYDTRAKRIKQVTEFLGQMDPDEVVFEADLKDAISFPQTAFADLRRHFADHVVTLREKNGKRIWCACPEGAAKLVEAGVAKAYKND